MPFAQPSPALRRPWPLVAAALLAFSACGGSEQPATPAPAVTPPAPAPAPVAKPADAQPAAVPAAPAAGPTGGASEVSLSEPSTVTPLAAPIEGPLEYEEAVDQPLVASFPSEQPVASAPPSIPDLPAADPLLGQPLVIDGEVIPFELVKQAVCLSGTGVAEIEQAKLLIFVAEERERRAKAGASDAQLAVSAEELDAFLGELEKDIQSEYPEGGVGMDDLLGGLATNDPKERLRAQRLFEKLFLPDDPAQFPPVTLDAILKQPGGDAVLEHFKTSHAERKESGAKKGMAERSFDSAILQQVHQHLLENADVVANPAPGVLYRVNGVDIPVEDVWNRIRPFVTTMEVRAAKQWLVNTTLIEKNLKAAGAWLSDEEAEAAYRQHSDPYKDSIFSQERIALVIKQFPSVERYKHYRRMYESFLRWKNPSAEDLAKQAEFRTNKVVGQVSVDVDVLLCSALEFKTNRWREQGWLNAENRMKDVLRLLVEEQRPWEELVERYSEFYEPPTPLSQRGQVDPNQPSKGRFRNFQRNNLLSSLGESEYGLFLNGTSITDFIFFQQEVGSLGDAMRGPVGWYLPRLIRRTKPPQRLPVDEATMKALVLDDYTSWHLNAYAQELIAKHEVYGLEYPER